MASNNWKGKLIKHLRTLYCHSPPSCESWHLVAGLWSWTFSFSQCWSRWSSKCCPLSSVCTKEVYLIFLNTALIHLTILPTHGYLSKPMYRGCRWSILIFAFWAFQLAHLNHRITLIVWSVRVSPDFQSFPTPNVAHSVHRSRVNENTKLSDVSNRMSGSGATTAR